MTLRDETEWVELVSCGMNRLAGADRDKIVKCYNESITSCNVFQENLYGNGIASETIIGILNGFSY